MTTSALNAASHRGLLLATACLLFALPGAALAEERDLPYRIDPLEEPVPNGTTLLLWRFEDGKATDSTIGENHGKLIGELEATGQGRFGKGMSLRGRGLALRAEKVKTHHIPQAFSESVLMVDFWCKVRSLPAKEPACMLELAGARGVRLELTPEGRLALRGEGLNTAETDEPVPAGKWFHVAVVPKELMQPNRIYLDKRCIEVLVNGLTAILLMLPKGWTLPAQLHPFCVGNSRRRHAGLQGWIDEVRVSKGAAGVYGIVPQDFATRDATEPLVRSQEHFRDPSAEVYAEVYAETFDEDNPLDRVEPPAKPKPIVNIPSVVQVASTGKVEAEPPDFAGEEEVDLVDEMMEEEKLREKIPPLALASGVRGKALVVCGGAARLELAKPLHLPDGTFEFWFKPGNWDNLAGAQAWDAGWTYRHRHAHLVTLWGLPREGEGEPVALIALSVRRDRGAAPVAPEFEKYFAQPRVRLVPHKWVHVLITWSQQFAHLRSYRFDGRWLERATLAEPETWRTHQAVAVTLGSGYETAFDELRLYGYPFHGVEHFNARALFTGEPQKVRVDDDMGAPVPPLADLKVACPGSPLFGRMSGGWRTGWVTGVATSGPARVFFGYRPDMGKMLVAVVLEGPGRVERADVVFHLPQGRKIKGTIPEFHEGKGGVLLDDVGLLPEDSFPLTGVLLDGRGKEVAPFRSTFRRMPIPWLNNRLGLPDTPPPPFEPVTVKGQVVGAVQREYEVGPDGNFRSLVVKDEQILASPIRFEAKVGDKVIALAGTGTEFGTCSPVEANWQSRAVGAGIEIRADVQFEYDGMARYEIDLRPVGGSVSVDRLSMQIPLKDEYARLFHVLPCGGRFRGYVTAGAFPPGGGPLWDSKTWSTRMRVGRPLGNFVSMLWLGGPIRGLVWFGDNDRGWVPNNEQPAATITRRDGVVTLGLHFISERFVLNEPRRITYGLLATPPKPLPRDHRLWNRGNAAEVGPISWRLTSCSAFAPWKVRPVGQAFHYWPLNDDWEFARLAVTEQRNLWNTETPHNKYPKGTSLILYHDFDHCPVHPAAEPYFRWAWRCRSFPQSRVDHLVWYIDKWIRAGIDGLYIDDTYPNCDWNEEPVGVAYFITADGKDYYSHDERDRQRRERRIPGVRKHAGMDHFRHRQYLKRLYAVFHSHGKRPILTTHMTDTLVWPFHSFVTSIYDGEHGARGHGYNKTYIDAWPLDYLLTMRNAERTGLITVNFGLQVPKDWRAKASPLWQYVTHRSLRAVILLFDSSHPPASRLEQLYYGTETEVYPFWRNSHLVQVEPIFAAPVTDRDLPIARWWTRISDHFYKSLAKQPLRVTLLKKENRCMVVVVNFLRRAVGAKVTLNLDELGVPRDQQASLVAEDIDNWLPPPGTDLAELHVADVPRTKSGEMLREIEAEGGFPDMPKDLDDSGGDEPADVEATFTRPEGGAIHVPKSEDDEQPAEPDPFFAVTLKGNVLTLNVAGHNFRAIELRWGPGR